MGDAHWRSQQDGAGQDGRPCALSKNSVLCEQACEGGCNTDELMDWNGCCRGKVNSKWARHLVGYIIIIVAMLPPGQVRAAPRNAQHKL